MIDGYRLAMNDWQGQDWLWAMYMYKTRRGVENVTSMYSMLPGSAQQKEKIALYTRRTSNDESKMKMCGA